MITYMSITHPRQSLSAPTVATCAKHDGKHFMHITCPKQLWKVEITSHIVQIRKLREVK